MARDPARADSACSGRFPSARLCAGGVHRAHRSSWGMAHPAGVADGRSVCSHWREHGDDRMGLPKNREAARLGSTSALVIALAARNGLGASGSCGYTECGQRVLARGASGPDSAQNICECGAAWSNETLLLAAQYGVRQAVAVLAHVARPAALYLMRCSRTQGTRPLYHHNNGHYAHINVVGSSSAHALDWRSFAAGCPHRRAGVAGRP